jgi:hypothetical protein
MENKRNEMKKEIKITGKKSGNKSFQSVYEMK